MQTAMHKWKMKKSCYSTAYLTLQETNSKSWQKENTNKLWQKQRNKGNESKVAQHIRDTEDWKFLITEFSEVKDFEKFSTQNTDVGHCTLLLRIWEFTGISSTLLMKN